MVAFYKHHIADWMDGTGKLSCGAYRAYHVICQLIYLREGPITLHERGIAGQCNQSVRAFRKYLAELVEAGKITVEGGIISNGRAILELENVNLHRENSKLGGENSAKTRIDPSKPLKTNGSAKNHFNHKTRLDNKESARACARAPERRASPAHGWQTADVVHVFKPRNDAPSDVPDAKILDAEQERRRLKVEAVKAAISFQ